MAGEPAWFELGVGDPERARKFYGELFGWEFEPVGDQGGSTIETGGLAGGLHGGDEGASPYLFFRVDDIESAMGKVRELGGEADELQDPDNVDQFGRFVMCKDDQGSAFGLHEPPGE